MRVYTPGKDFRYKEKVMTGINLYGLWRTAMLEEGISTDYWDLLRPSQKEAWKRLAKVLQVK